MTKGQRDAVRYELGRRIAAGGMAEVFEGWAVSADGSRARVAVKRLLPHLGDSDALADMFVDEARIASQLRHRNIVEILDVGTIDERHSIVMEFVEGVDLRALIGTPPMSVPLATFIVAEILAGLAFAHERAGPTGDALGIVHRDVSPANILLSTRGEVKLADFGVAKATLKTTRTLAGLLKGKLAYMSPEQARGLPVDGRSDVFAAALVLFELLVGRPVFDGATDLETLERIRTFQPPSVGGMRSDLAPELDALIIRAMARDPARRPATAREMRDALLVWADGAGLGALVQERMPRRETLLGGLGAQKEKSVAKRGRLKWAAASIATVVVSGLVVVALPRHVYETFVTSQPIVNEPRALGSVPVASAGQVSPRSRISDAGSVRFDSIDGGTPPHSIIVATAHAALDKRGRSRHTSRLRAGSADASVTGQFGTLSLQTVPYWATISLVGHKWPGRDTTPVTGVRLPAGEYKVRLRYEPEGLELIETVRIEPGKDTTHIARFKVRAEGPVP